MDVFVILICWVQREGNRAEPTKPIPVKECLQWIHTCDHHIDTHVKFVSVNEEWILDITLYNDRLTI